MSVATIELQILVLVYFGFSLKRHISENFLWPLQGLKTSIMTEIHGIFRGSKPETFGFSPPKLWS